MPHYLFVTLLHILPSFLIIFLFFLIFDVSLRSSSTANPPLKGDEPDIDELEKELQKLIENNNLNIKKDILQQELSLTPTNIISAYINTNKKDLKGFHLFQLIFSLIKNGNEDAKIIKILRHYLPASPLSHLYAILKSCKEFLNISQKDNKQRELLSKLNQNKLKNTLLYLQKKINDTLNLVAYQPPALQQPIIDVAVTYGLIFASFAQFYNKKSTEKILRLCNMLSPELFLYWHQPPKKSESSPLKIPPSMVKKHSFSHR